ncbi:MAG TPA: hypothetical protein IGS52_05530 [Oscillatoriaceae cyanobacterium M33_DOE_052]|uniref:Uncharacterized protein n=1 Tax=Planktothricoides sp. SpSt-374 TaxID=2282167 RepID=A0A7C3VIH8_9CYAN|nr:hypothetical protein [Oscillatoriaceae cyanobacterium M33_DOE_052]
MSVILTPAEIDRVRSQLSSDGADLKVRRLAIAALDEIEACEGDLEDAAIALAIQAGMTPDTSDRWLEGLAKRCRPAICQSLVKQELLQENINLAVDALAEARVCPGLLLAPVAIYVWKTGAEAFCEPLDYKIN